MVIKQSHPGPTHHAFLAMGDHLYPGLSIGLEMHTCKIHPVGLFISDSYFEQLDFF
jgi:hypothetical protein